MQCFLVMSLNTPVSQVDCVELERGGSMTIPRNIGDIDLGEHFEYTSARN